jgi:hypothetical protein
MCLSGPLILKANLYYLAFGPLTEKENSEQEKNRGGSELDAAQSIRVGKVSVLGPCHSTLYVCRAGRMWAFRFLAAAPAWHLVNW